MTLFQFYIGNPVFLNLSLPLICQERADVHASAPQSAWVSSKLGQLPIAAAIVRDHLFKVGFHGVKLKLVRSIRVLLLKDLFQVGFHCVKFHLDVIIRSVVILWSLYR